MKPARLLLAAALLCLSHPVWAQTAERLRGTVETAGPDALSLATRDGRHVTVKLTAQTGYTEVLPSSLSDIKPGSYIGTAAVPGKGGVLVALEVHVFPEAMRGLGDGHRPFDLQPESTMTNGTVGDVTASNGETLTVTYNGGKQTVIVPPDAPIVTMAPGDAGLLAPGAHAIVFATRAADGSYTAGRILAGRNGLVPPM